jgi:eukaryotic-like serine/threonine-protein kinase
VRWLSNAVVDHLRNVADWPDFSATKYEVVDKIARGGMASVYRGLDRELGRPVALKVLSTPLSSPQTRDRMLKEAQIIARLEHPGIIPVHDSGVLPDGRIYYAMKLIRGKQLDEQVDLETPLSERLRIFERICQTVAFAHAHGVIHRDLKPQNIMVGPFGEVLVMDWGLARSARAATRDRNQAGSIATANGEESGDTQTGAVMGTPGYMAPEQARGEIEQLDHRADVYSLGAILYFLLTGETPASVPAAGREENSTPTFITPPRKKNQLIARPLQAICMKALSYKRDDRYQSVADLAADTGRFLAQARVDAYPEGLVGTTWRLASKYRTAILLVLAYLVVRVILLLLPLGRD